MNRTILTATAIFGLALTFSDALAQTLGVRFSGLSSPAWLDGVVVTMLVALIVAWWKRGAVAGTAAMAAAGSPLLARWQEALVGRFTRSPFPAPAKPAANPAVGPDSLTEEMMQQIDEAEYAQLVTQFFGALGFRTKPRVANSGERTDVYLYRGDETLPLGLVRCKWHSLEVGEHSVRELEAVMLSEHLSEGYVVTTGIFTAAARAREKGSGIMLFDGRQFLTRFNYLSKMTRVAVIARLIAAREARKPAT